MEAPELQPARPFADPRLNAKIPEGPLAQK